MTAPLTNLLQYSIKRVAQKAHIVMSDLGGKTVDVDGCDVLVLEAQ